MIKPTEVQTIDKIIKVPIFERIINILENASPDQREEIFVLANLFGGVSVINVPKDYRQRLKDAFCRAKQMTRENQFVNNEEISHLLNNVTLNFSLLEQREDMEENKNIYNKL